MRLIALLFVVVFTVAPLAQAEPSSEVQVKSAREKHSMSSGGSTLESIQSLAVFGAIFIAVIMADDFWEWLDGPGGRGW